MSKGDAKGWGQSEKSSNKDTNPKFELSEDQFQVLKNIIEQDQSLTLYKNSSQIHIILCIDVLQNSSFLLKSKIVLGFHLLNSKIVSHFLLGFLCKSPIIKAQLALVYKCFHVNPKLNFSLKKILSQTLIPNLPTHDDLCLIFSDPPTCAIPQSPSSGCVIGPIYTII